MRILKKYNSNLCFNHTHLINVWFPSVFPLASLGRCAQRPGRLSNTVTPIPRYAHFVNEEQLAISIAYYHFSKDERDCVLPYCRLSVEHNKYGDGEKGWAVCEEVTRYRCPPLRWSTENRTSTKRSGQWDRRRMARFLLVAWQRGYRKMSGVDHEWPSTGLWSSSCWSPHRLKHWGTGIILITSQVETLRNRYHPDHLTGWNIEEPVPRPFSHLPSIFKKLQKK